MMDITKSREEFEKVILAMGMLIVRARGGAYDVEEVELAWIIWQAARGSIEVELPERATLERCGINKGRYVCWPCSFDPEYALGINHTIDWLTEALRAAGIRIKGESE
ncbi:hypothetical protein [Yersinia ruckeri]|uniref:hypothetical protein n=1 Tax=Yersinia ruckeri TaxID=29486 RepID=UPI0011A0538C|nr:hypothetical protein [Yersinia ruckeri]MCW6540490.1 hypothetical protein [Yersinia ruckeri]UZY12363.1 hypothetical protein LNQ46_004935 [Yersinia ruckeri]